MSTKDDALDVLRAVSAFAPVAELLASVIAGKPEAVAAVSAIPHVAERLPEKSASDKAVDIIDAL